MNAKVWWLVGALALPALQGCFPLAATGVVASALSASDRRSTGAQVDDQAIELRGMNRLRERFPEDKLAAGLVSFNRRALIYGLVANEDIKRQAEETVRGLPNVREVVNELEVMTGIARNTYGNDALITSKIKANLLKQEDLPGSHIKVITERGIVYLMGVVSEREGAAAAKVAAGADGVARVVKVFEYISEDEARRLGGAAASTAGGQQR